MANIYTWPLGNSGGGGATGNVNLTQVGGASIFLGQTTMANSLPVVLASNQSAIPVSQSGVWTVQPGNTANTTPWLVTVSTALPAGGNTIGAVTQASGPWTSNITQIGGAALAFGQALMAASIPVVLASNQSPIPVTPAVNTNGSFVGSTTITTSATTFSPPTNAVGFIIEASSSNTVNLRWAIVTTPTTTSGMRLEPGRDSGYVPCAANLLVIAESGSAQEVEITWVKSS